MTLYESWKLTLAMLLSSAISGVGFLAMAVLSLLHSLIWFCCQPFKWLASVWRMVRGG